jgi:HEPN domain-containing protein
LSTPEEREVAALLVRQAASDLAAARALAADADQLDDVVGFHVQQAVEKAIKSALASQGVEVPRTHDLTYLVEVAMERGIEAPLSLDDAERLTPWAVATRYDEVVAGLDRAAALELAVAAVDWARAVTAPTG